MSSRPVPQTSVGKLVSLSVDNPKYYTSQQQQQQQQQPPSVSPPPLFPNSDLHNEEQTMLWRNIATLFAKCDQNEEELQKHQESYERLTRGTDELYQELQETKNEIQRETNENNLLSTHVRKLRKYVNKKCENVRETIAYGSYNSDNEIFAYIDKMRSEFQAKTAKMEDEITILQEKLIETTHIYDSDYTMFVQRENDLMAKLDQSVQMTETLSQRIKDHEGIIMHRLEELRNYTDQQQYQIQGDLREEFTRAICREVEYESNETAKLVALINDDTEQKIDLVMNHIQKAEYCLRAEIATSRTTTTTTTIDREASRLVELSEQMTQDVSDKMTDLITRSNEYHTARYFGLVDEIKTMKQSIGMVDAELSDVKETVEFLKDEVADTGNDVYDIKEDMNDMKDDVYREMDSDYYDMKDYVKRRFHRHEKQKHAVVTADVVTTADALQMIVTEYEGDTAVPDAAVPAPENDEHIIIIDADTFMIDDDDEETQHT